MVIAAMLMVMGAAPVKAATSSTSTAGARDRMLRKGREILLGHVPGRLMLIMPGAVE